MSWQIWYPFTFGSMMSSRINCGGVFAMAASAITPLGALTTCTPWRFRVISTILRIVGLSSTTSTTGPATP